MEDIFNIRFTFEQKVKDQVIYTVSAKQNGDFNVFAYHWQCFAWAAIIGFLRNEKRPLAPPIADKPFNLKTMMNNEGEKVAQALICLAIARAGTLEIMKNPVDAINLINEYANGGFYHIMKLMENGENSFNDLEKVKQEIFSRNYDVDCVSQPAQQVEEYVVPEEGFYNKKEVDKPTEDTMIEVSKVTVRKTNRWSLQQEKELVGYYQAGMTIDQLAKLFGKDEDAVREKLAQKGISI